MNDPRSHLAAERTLLAWIRTSIGIMAFGFVVARLGLFLQALKPTASIGPESIHLSFWVGTGLLVFSGVINIVAIAQYIDLIGKLNRGEEYIASKWSLGVIVSALLTGLALVLAGWLAFLGHS